MTNCLSRFGRRRPRQTPDGTRPDPTRPGAARIHDGVPIAHEGSPGFPGRNAVPADDEGLR